MATTTIVTRGSKGSALTHTEMDTNWNNLLGATIYVGTTIIWWSPTAPDSKWLLCEGQALATASYPDLFTLLGYSFGGSGGTFYLPDTRGMFTRGWAHGSGIDPDVATRTNRGDGGTGDLIGTKQADAYQAHTHPDGSGRNRVISAATSFGISEGFGGGTSAAAMGTGTGNTSTETRPKNIYCAYLIKALK